MNKFVFFFFKQKTAYGVWAVFGGSEMVIRERLRDVKLLALDAWARHYGIEPSEEDVMEMIESMAPGHEKELLEELSQDPAQLEALSIAVMRFAANKHLAATAIVE